MSSVPEALRGLMMVGLSRDEARPLPAFFLRWRAGWGDEAESWTPTDYLNRESSVPAVISAGWLFNPDTVEYRGALFLAERFDSETIDAWFDGYPAEPGRIEAVVNQVALFDLFVNVDLDAYADALPALARDLAACWLGVLTLRYPDRIIHVEAADGAMSGSDGPAVSFWSEPRHSGR